MSEICINHIENYWKAKTTTSNVLFNKGQFKEALLGYKNALYRAEILNMNQSDCIRNNTPFMQIYIISCNNIANTYKELNLFEETENTLKRIVYYLLYLSHNNDLNIAEVRTELKRATTTYVNFIKENQKDKKQQETLFTVLKERLKEV
ncbi:tetratricopeptide repeat protein [Aquimarina sp. 2201CG5-10]|uniref:tetratricopeptide repeat protein n=1 Tax=Aquimarina callyspongiae TaxID=3098150 RepID=UPI002AB554BB|nr:tetratricopeptide repeat protein [Aquimarina sp. 2201CG5-10]MDY8136619.1 tetratricopeptide repeat protein [Aquimarina sp. 2201CG5-10]